jgi:NitT/TauT family transport system substrate-binding protein
MKRIVIMTVLASILAAGCSDRRDPASVRLGYFPNLTHAQALIGMAGGRLAELTGLPIQERSTCSTSDRILH